MYNTTLIFGTGACENSWMPIHKALSCYYKNGIEDCDLANTLLALWIFSIRQCYANKKFEDVRKLYSSLLETKHSIANKIRDSVANGEIIPRDSFKHTIDKIGKYSNISNVITTNWDKAADGLFSSNAIHIHGSCESGEDLYLPTETSVESYRPEKTNKSFINRHCAAENAISNSDIAIVFGLSFSPLDAELYTIFFGHQEKPQKIIIIDPNHKHIAGRLQFAFMHRDEFIPYGVAPEEGEIDRVFLEAFQ